jgi:hypothetical protein
MIAPAGLRHKLFIATKLESSLTFHSPTPLPGFERELISEPPGKGAAGQFDPQQSLSQFKAWKAQGVCRYIGITSTRHADFPAIEGVGAGETRFRADRLFARRPRSRKAHPAARGRGQSRRPHRVTVRPCPAPKLARAERTNSSRKK